ncbi:MAG TPA: VOC family protein [Ignavibacteriaceae bacterium]|nr:VOC family protein [Ignavibacteriaceae bacterium]
MATLNPYLNFPGNTEEAFNFYKSVFGGDFAGGIFRFKDTPEAEKLSKNDREKVMHVSLPVGKGNMLMATDAIESMGHKVTAGNNFYLSLEAESKDEADKLFKGLSTGGKVTQPLEDAFWGAYFGMVTDKFGIQWMVNYTYPKNN